MSPTCAICSLVCALTRDTGVHAMHDANRLGDTHGTRGPACSACFDASWMNIAHLNGAYRLVLARHSPVADIHGRSEPVCHCCQVVRCASGLVWGLLANPIVALAARPVHAALVSQLAKRAATPKPSLSCQRKAHATRFLFHRRRSFSRTALLQLSCGAPSSPRGEASNS